MDNLGQFFKDGIKRVSEAAVDVVVTSIVANQEHHLHNLQDLQKWGIFKLIKRWTTSKYLHQHPNAVRFHGWSLLDFFNQSKKDKKPDVHLSAESASVDGSHTNLGTLDTKKSSGSLNSSFLASPLSFPAVGQLRIQVFSGLLTLFEHGHPFNDNDAEKYQWKVVVMFECQQQETPCCVMMRDMNDAECIRKPDQLATSQMPTSRQFLVVQWNAPLVFDSVKDLWSDICLDVLWRETSNKDCTSCVQYPHSECSIKLDFPVETEVSRMVESVYIKNMENEIPIQKKTLKDCNNDEDQDTRLGNQSLVEVHDNKTTKQSSGSESHWLSYGRAIIPLVSLLSSAETSFVDHYLFPKELYVQQMEHRSGSFHSSCENIQNKKTNREVNSISSFFVKFWNMFQANWSSTHDLWLNLYPHHSKELKYYRPVSGYPSLGMLNPQASLGFLSIRISFFSPMSKFGTSLLSTVHAPTSRWITSFFFEPQYLETYGLRARHLLTRMPRWVSKFLHLLPSSESCDRNVCDYLFILVFWISTIYGTLFLPIYCLPLCCLLNTISVSLSYRFGHHLNPPCRFSLLYEERCFHPCCELSSCKKTEQEMFQCGKKHNAGDTKESDWMFTKSQILYTEDNLMNNSTHKGEMNVVEPNVSSRFTTQSVQGGISSTKVTEDITSIKTSSCCGPLFENVEANPTHRNDTEHYSKLNLDASHKKPASHFHCHNSGGISPFCTFSSNAICQLNNRIHSTQSIHREDIVYNDKSNNFVNLQPRPYEETSCKDYSSFEPSNNTKHGMFLPHPTHTSIIRSPLGLFSLSVRDPTSYCPRYPIFSDDAADQDIQFVLESISNLLNGVQRATGLLSCLGEKFKFAFNWEDPLISSVSCFVLCLVCFQLTLVFFILLKIPRWIARLPLLFPLFLFIFLTDPWIKENFWFNFFGVNITMFYYALFSRTPQQWSSTGHSPRHRCFLDPDVNDNIKLSPRPTPVNHVENLSLVRKSRSPSPNSWKCLRQRFKNMIPKKTKVSDPEEEKVLNQYTTEHLGIPNEKSHQPYQIYFGEKRFHPAEAQGNKAVSVLSVNTKVVGPYKTKRKLLISFWFALFFQLLTSILIAVRKITASTLNLLYHHFFSSLWVKIRLLLVLCFLILLHIIDTLFRFLWHWWLRLPDRREIEHRQIAATQYIPSCSEKILYSFDHPSSLESLKEDFTVKWTGKNTNSQQLVEEAPHQESTQMVYGDKFCLSQVFTKRESLHQLTSSTDQTCSKNKHQNDSTVTFNNSCPCENKDSSTDLTDATATADDSSLDSKVERHQSLIAFLLTLKSSHVESSTKQGIPKNINQKPEGKLGFESNDTFWEKIILKSKTTCDVFSQEKLLDNCVPNDISVLPPSSLDFNKSSGVTSSEQFPSQNSIGRYISPHESQLSVLSTESKHLMKNFKDNLNSFSNVACTLTIADPGVSSDLVKLTQTEQVLTDRKCQSSLSRLSSEHQYESTDRVHTEEEMSCFPLCQEQEFTESLLKNQQAVIHNKQNVFTVAASFNRFRSFLDSFKLLKALGG